MFIETNEHEVNHFPRCRKIDSQLVDFGTILQIPANKLKLCLFYLRQRITCTTGFWLQICTTFVLTVNIVNVSVCVCVCVAVGGAVAHLYTNEELNHAHFPLQNAGEANVP